MSFSRADDIRPYKEMGIGNYAVVVDVVLSYRLFPISSHGASGRRPLQNPRRPSAPLQGSCRGEAVTEGLFRFAQGNK